MAERAIPYNVSLYDNQVKIIKDYKTKGNFPYESTALQAIIDFFEKNHKKVFMKDILVFVIYPAIIALLLNRIANTIFDINNDMIKQGIPFEALYRFGTVIQLGGLAVTVFLVTNIVIFIIQAKKQR